MLRSLLLTGTIFILSLGILLTILFQIDPLGEGKTLIYSALFLALFSGISSFITLLIFFGSEILSKHKLGSRHFLVALRRGILVGVFVTIAALLQLFRLWGIFEGLLLATFLVLIEYVILSAKVR